MFWKGAGIDFFGGIEGQNLSLPTVKVSQINCYSWIFKINPFQANVLFTHHRKTSKKKGFLMFSAGISKGSIGMRWLTHFSSMFHFYTP